MQTCHSLQFRGKSQDFFIKIDKKFDFPLLFCRFKFFFIFLLNSLLLFFFYFDLSDLAPAIFHFTKFNHFLLNEMIKKKARLNYVSFYGKKKRENIILRQVGCFCVIKDHPEWKHNPVYSICSNTNVIDFLFIIYYSNCNIEICIIVETSQILGSSSCLLIPSLVWKTLFSLSSHPDFTVIFSKGLILFLYLTFTTWHFFPLKIYINYYLDIAHWEILKRAWVSVNIAL